MIDDEIFDDIDDTIEPKSKKKKPEQEMGEPSMWAIIGTVFLCVVIILMIVYNREKEKPDSPQAYVTAKFSQLFNIQEWKPGMGTQPLLYHPAAFNAPVQNNSPVWKPLPNRGSYNTLAAFG
ncbi:MAG: hypothetical protein HQK70_14645 [Desulfamplus sp.]|nr:hypothetical protein [Desulfamplus sp.]